MLLWFELNKTLLSTVLIVFAVLCIAVNIVIVFANSDAYSYTERESEPYNAFEDYDASGLADYYVAVNGMTGRAEKNIRDKYDRLQTVIDEKAAEGDALSVYFGQGTYTMHGLLFGDLFFAVIAEGCLIALFAALMSTGYENTRNTEQIVSASKTGRKILRTKFVASLITGLAAFTVILAVSLTVFFTNYDFSAVWKDNVSSSFNFAPGEYLKPFITWHSFTVFGFLLAVIGAATGLVIVFALFGFAVGAFFRSGYLACGVTISLCVLQFVLPWLLQMGGTLRGVLNLMPVMLWANSGKWFTDGGPQYIWANFESVGLAVSFLLFAASSVIAVSLYKRRDLL